MNNDDKMLEVTLTLMRDGTLHRHMTYTDEIQPEIASTLEAGILVRALSFIKDSETPK
jgi:hypothetical protein